MKFQIAYPIKPANINQPFGSNPQLYSDPKYGGIKGHNGIDFQAYHGQPVYAAHDGMAYYEYDGNQGQGVVLRTNYAFDDGLGGWCYYKTIYWHMCDCVKEPQFTSPIYKAVGYKPDQTGVSQTGIAVKRGDLLGYADNTGASSGDHLHFGLKPQAQNESNGAWYNPAQDNGYNGAIDPQPFFDGTFAQDSQAQTIQTLQAKVSILKRLIALWKQLWGLQGSK